MKISRYWRHQREK